MVADTNPGCFFIVGSVASLRRSTSACCIVAPLMLNALNRLVPRTTVSRGDFSARLWIPPCQRCHKHPQHKAPWAGDQNAE
jgi:hypothetical protein